MFLPFLVAFSTTHIGSPDWTPHARFHLAASSFGNILALPIMLYAIWYKTLFGTGRSVRLMAYLGLAYVLGVFIAGAFSQKLGLDTDANIFMKGLIFALLLLGVFFSIRRGSD